MSAELNASSPTSFMFAAPEDLRVDLRREAFGVPWLCPTFSWAMRSGEVNDIQTSYRIVLARRRADLLEEDYLLDTGWIVTDESSNVQLAGLDTVLADNELYYWAVQVRNKSGAVSALSAPAAFSTAIGEDWEDTHGLWAPPLSETAPADFAFLRTEFDLSGIDSTEEIECALLSMTATSPEPSRQFVYHVFVNGQSVGVGPARMGRALGGEELLYYHTYDVTSLLQADKNALGAVCYTTAEHAFLGQLTLFYRDGSKDIILNSGRDAEHFSALDGHAVFGVDGASIGTPYFFAAPENINATLYPFGFATVGFDAAAWSPAIRLGDVEAEQERLLAPYPGDPVKRFPQEIARIEQRGRDHYFIDLGQEVVGGLQVTFEANAPHTVTLRYGEELDDKGNLVHPMRTGNRYEERWTLDAGRQTIETVCSLKTFRYVEILGCEATIREDEVFAIALRRAFDAAESSFTCSNAALCRLYDTYKYAICATNQDLYVDSQSRERRAYEGDALINMLSSYTYESNMALPRFTIDHLLSHRTWPAEYALMPIHMVRLDYLYSGNRALLEQVYPHLHALITAEHPDPKVGLYPSKAIPNNSFDSILVDWPVLSRDGYEMEASYYNTVYNALMYLSLRDMAVMASVLGKEDDSTAFTATADALRRDMVELLYDAAHTAFCDGADREGKPVAHFAQHATIFALCCGIYADAAMKDAMGRYLVGQESIRTSIYGAFFLLNALYTSGFGAYATALMADDDLTPGAHSFLASLGDGRVTIAPEAWHPSEKGNMTFSHPWGTAPATMIVRGMFGIRPTRPGFHKFEIRPQIGDLPYASIRVPTVKGAIVVSLGQNREAYEAEVTVPANTTATVYLPLVAGGTDTLFVNNQRSNFPIENGSFRISLGAGTHRLLAQ